MEIHGLGHSAFVVSMESAGEPVRILADPWLSDYAIGDLMGRYPRVRCRAGELPPLDAIFLSHAHTDHLDPESLVRLWRELPVRPPLLLPQSLLFLRGLLGEHLAGAEFLVLEEDRPIEIRGVALTGFFNPEPRPSNEDDVMALHLTNGRESFLSEADALLPYYDPEFREEIADRMLDPDYESIVLLSSRNELAATFATLDARDARDRQVRVDLCLERTCAEIEGLYSPFDELDPDLWADERVVRFVAGQGICYPQVLDAARNRTLFPIRIEDRVRLERELADALGCRHRVEALLPGVVFEVSRGLVAQRGTVPYLTVLDREQDRIFDPGRPAPGEFPDGPLRDEERDESRQEARIGAALNERFLPHMIGMREPPFERLLASLGGEYRIRVRFGTAAEFRERDYVVSFADARFAAHEPRSGPQEAYWANDVEDVLDGRADEFSRFPRRPIPAPAQRFWCCLGMPYLNGDLVEKKLRFHFERATRNETNAAFVLPFYGDRKS